GMLIRIHCPNPNCRKQLRIDARHAGKKIACQGCKQHIRLPTAEELKLPARTATVGAESAEGEPIVDFDMLAQEAVITEKQEQEASLQELTVNFTCPHCDEPVQLAAEHAGKRAPCPSCRRIIAVPKLDTGKPKDWREKQAQGPSLAKKEEVKLEGAWGNENIAKVSIEALEEAKALPRIKRKLTLRDYATYTTYAVMLLAVLGAGYWGWNRWRSAALVGNTLASVDQALQDNKLPAELLAVLRLAKGEWLLEAHSEMDKQRDALAELRKCLTTTGDPAWNWALALDVVRVISPQISLDPKVEKPLVDLNWLVQLVSAVKSGEPREDVLRALSRGVLAQAGENREKITLAQNLLTSIIKQAVPPATFRVNAEGASVPTNITDYSEQLSALGVLAQELVQAKAQENAIILIGNTPTSGARTLFKKEMPVPRAFVAAMSALNQPPLEVKTAEEGDLDLGQLVGYYLANQAARAQEILQKRKDLGLTEANLIPFLELAQQAIDGKKNQEALIHLNDAMQIAQIYTSRRDRDWRNRVYAHLKLCVLTARTGEIVLAEERIQQLKLDEIPALGQLARGLVARERSWQDSAAALQG
ncbi:MAG TPA: hypothetical protein PKD72_14410, partial [Gemmatales bacterium]|nr:hypothetical protein [Gemmatales bacterium]